MAQPLDHLQPPNNAGGLKARHIASPRTVQSALRANRAALAILQNWAAELSSIRILDPACGSGNFLYIALKKLLDLWQEARIFAIEHALALAPEPIPSPTQLFGIEVDFYAHEIASIVVWIGFLQWKRDHGEARGEEPILRPLTNIQHADAILRYDADNKPYEPTWPEADYIIGNPPFLGSRRLKSELGETYVTDLFALYEARVPQEADLVTYWFSKALDEIEIHACRVGLLATQAIRAGANRIVLNRISEKGSIFFAWSNREWTLEGAAVRVAMVGFDNGAEQQKELDGAAVDSINIDLSTGNDLTQAAALEENRGISYQGPVKVGHFEVEPHDARKMLTSPVNPNGHANAEVIVPWINAKDLTGRPKGMYIIDFQNMSEGAAALFELPFQYVRKHVYPKRLKNKRPRRREHWWQHGERNLGMRKALQPLSRFIASPRVAKHRFFVFVAKETLADSRIVVIARQDDYFIGVLESQLHHAWSIASSSRHGVGNDPTYNIESCFDTFPFPWPPGTEPSESESPIVKAIADAARSLVTLRDNWLNPKPAPGEPPIPESDLKKRTLTNLYNERPTWLSNAHRALDEAVFTAYGWPSNLTTQQILSNLLALNHQRAATQPSIIQKPSRSNPAK